MDDNHKSITDISGESMYPAEEALDIAAPADITFEQENLMNNKTSEEQLELIKKARNGLELSIESDEVVNYAIQQQGIPIIDDICIKNTTDQDMEDLMLSIDSDTGLIDEFELGIQSVRAGEELHVRNLKIKINGDYLASLT